VLHWQASRVKSAGRRGGSAPTPGYPSPLLDVPTHREQERKKYPQSAASHVVHSWTPGLRLRSPSSQGFRPVRAGQVLLPNGRDPFCVRADAALPLFRVDEALSLDWNLRCVPCWGSSSRGGLEIDTHTHTHTHTHGHGCLTVFHLYAVNFTRTGPIHPGFTCVNS
jgi:hypothetical protein